MHEEFLTQLGLCKTAACRSNRKFGEICSILLSGDLSFSAMSSPDDLEDLFKSRGPQLLRRAWAPVQARPPPSLSTPPSIRLPYPPSALRPQGSEAPNPSEGRASGGPGETRCWPGHPRLQVWGVWPPEVLPVPGGGQDFALWGQGAHKSAGAPTGGWEGRRQETMAQGWAKLREEALNRNNRDVSRPFASQS